MNADARVIKFEWLQSCSVLVESFEKVSVVRGHHIYKAVRTPTFGKEMLLEAEKDNKHDKHTVSVVRGSNSCIVGHIPQKDSRIFWFFLKHSGQITWKLGVGLEVPCIYIFFASTTIINKLCKLHS